MIDIKLSWYSSENFWKADDAPKNLIDKGVAWVSGERYISSAIKEYLICDIWQKCASDLTFQTSSIHGRSCYLGTDENKNHYFAKGIGWVLTDGWNPQFGSLGILPLWAAKREKDIAFKLKSIGIDVVTPISIQIHSDIPVFSSGGNDFINAESVPDLDDTKAFPSMYIYRSKCRWRLADLVYLDSKSFHSIINEFGDINEWFVQLIEKISQSVAILHLNGGYDYSLSPHNVFISGERLDFEYVVVDGIPHKDDVINKNPDSWMNKELYALKLLTWEIAEVLNIKYDGNSIDALVKNKYEEISSRKFPY